MAGACCYRAPIQIDAVSIPTPMSLSVFFTAIALAHAALLILSCRGGNAVADWIVRALLVALIYDNTVLALSGVAIDASWYYSASWFRYIAHVFVLPPLAVAALLVCGRAGIQSLNGRPALLTGIVFAVFACCFGFVTEIAGLELMREALGGHIRYVSTDVMPPLATIVTNTVVLVLAALIWRKTGWPWLFAAALWIFLVNGVSAGRPWSIVAGNMAEVVFALGWVLTLRRFKSTPIDNSHLRAD